MGDEQADIASLKSVKPQRLTWRHTLFVVAVFAIGIFTVSGVALLFNMLSLGAQPRYGTSPAIYATAMMGLWAMKDYPDSGARRWRWLMATFAVSAATAAGASAGGLVMRNWAPAVADTFVGMVGPLLGGFLAMVPALMLSARYLRLQEPETVMPGTEMQK